MNNLCFAICLFTALGIVSCKKDVSSSKTPPPLASVVGKWNVVTDSLAGSIGPGNYTSTSKYIGKSGDYFNFTGNGNLYAKEGDFLLDTAAYFIKSNELNLTYSYLYEDGVTIFNTEGSYSITNANVHILTLTRKSYTPGGYSYEYLVLSK